MYFCYPEFWGKYDGSLCNSGAFSNPNAVQEFPFNLKRFFSRSRNFFSYAALLFLKLFSAAQQNIFYKRKSKGEKTHNYEPNEFDRMRVNQFLSETVAMHPQYWIWSLVPKRIQIKLVRVASSAHSFNLMHFAALMIIFSISTLMNYVFSVPVRQCLLTDVA
jgi:hypothetical protein